MSALGSASDSQLVIVSLAEGEVATACDIVNESAMAYKGVIPSDCWHEPYMPLAHLKSEIAKGVRFYGCHLGEELVGVMGIQDVKDVTLIRHAYIRTAYRSRGIGRALLQRVAGLTERPILVGAWKDAVWAVRFYQHNGFTLLDPSTKNRLLDTYWTIAPRQRDESVVLANPYALAKLIGKTK